MKTTRLGVGFVGAGFNARFHITGWTGVRDGDNGFFWAAAFGLMRIFVSDYPRLKKTVGLSHYTEAAMLEKLKGAGFAAERAPRNIGHNQRRMTFLTRAV